MKKRKRAIIKYGEFNKTSGFIINIEDASGELVFESFYPLQENNFLHFSILLKCRELQNYGYEILF